MMLHKRLIALLTAAIITFTAVPTLSASGWTPDSGDMDVYRIVAGKNNGGDTIYSNYRIPGIVVTKEDTVIVYWEARMTSSDWADMDILAMRSEDGGNTFGEPIIITEGASIGATVNNPVMIVGNDGTLHLLYCVEYGVCTVCGDAATSECTHGPGVFYKTSKDDGKTWSEPKNISDSTFSDKVDHYVIATGPGHGIALTDGTLLCAVWMVEPQNLNGGITSHHTGSVSTLYSKDNGETWQIGDIVPNDNTDGSAVSDPNETMPVETSDGGVMLNIRSGGGGYRALAWSPNGYSDWTTMEYDKDLIDPTCMGSVNKYDVTGDPYTLLLVNCESQSGRSNLVLKGSTDDGETWSLRKTIEPGSAGYSDIAVDSKGTIYILYEVSYGVTCNLARLNYECLVSTTKEETFTAPENTTVLHLNGESFSDALGYQKKYIENTDVTLNTSTSAFGSGCYEFNGNDGDTSAIDILQTTALKLTKDNFSASAWFKPDSVSGTANNQQIIFWYGGVGAGKPQVWCRTRNSDLQCNFSSNGVETTLTATSVLEIGKWHHVVLVRDGMHHYMYLDGELVASADSSFVHDLDGDRSLTVGASRTTSSRNRIIDGCIDEVKFFNYALDTEDIQTLRDQNTVKTHTLGDANSNGNVNTVDLAYLQRYLAEWSDYASVKINLTMLDLDGDGKVNSSDAAVLARHLASWNGYETLPHQS